MGKVRFDIVEENLTKRAASSYELSILLGMDSFAYMVSDDTQQVLALRDYALEQARTGRRLTEVEQIINGDKHLKGAHRNIRIACVEAAATFIPERLYNPIEKKSYLEQLTELSPAQQVRTDDLLHYGLKTVYPLDRGTEDLLQRFFPGGRIFHIHSALLHGIWETELSDGQARLFVNVHGADAQVLLLRGRKLVFANLFHYESSKDFLYYVMLAFDQFQLDPENTPLRLSGRLVEDSEIYRLLQRYVRLLDFLKPPAFFSLGPKLNREPGHFYFDLLSLVFCS